MQFEFRIPAAVRILLTWTLVISLLSFLNDAPACSICAPIGQTLTEEIADAAAVLVVSPRSEVSKYDVLTRIKVRNIDVDEQLASLSKEKVSLGKTYLVIGFGSPRIQWKSPKAVNKGEIEYLELLSNLPATGPDRLIQLLPLLESPHRLIADDAYNEFALATVPELRELRGRIDCPWLIERIRALDTRDKLRRVYWLLLGVCGTAENSHFVRSHLKARTPNDLPTLDASIACYLSLAGPKGMEFINQEFGSNPKGQELFAVLAALRFHGEEETKVPRKELASGMRLLLDQAQVADQVIADLTRWEDWGALDRVMRLLEETKESSVLLRRQAIQFLLACPEPSAKKWIKELSERNPKELERAQQRLFPSPVPIPKDEP